MPDVGAGAALSAGGSVLGGLLGSSGASKAAKTQADASKAAIAEQTREYDLGRADLAPYRNVGQAALYMLSDYLGLPPSASAAAFSESAPTREQFTKYAQPSFDPNASADGYSQAPTGVSGGFDEAGYNSALSGYNQRKSAFEAGLPTAGPNTGSLLKPFSFDISQDPGYQFRMDEGNKAVENSAAARGSQLSGATLKELLKYGSDYASGEYNAAFQRDQATKAQTYGMLSGTAGMGQGATNTTVQAGQNTASNIGSLITGAGNATAAGQVGSANALSGALSGAGNAVNQAMLLKSVFGNPGVNAVNSGVNLGAE